MLKVEIFSRRGCHLCQVAENIVREVQTQHPFDLSVTYVDGEPELESRFGEEVPVTLINGEKHDYLSVKKQRFTDAIIAKQKDNLD